MRLSEILDGLAEGKTYTRTAWLGLGRYIRIYDGMVVCTDLRGRSRAEPYPVIPYAVTAEDIRADDWQEVHRWTSATSSKA